MKHAELITNFEKVKKEANREWRETNKLKISAKKRLVYDSNSSSQKAAAREFSRRRFALNPLREREASRLSFVRNPSPKRAAARKPVHEVLHGIISIVNIS